MSGLSRNNGSSSSAYKSHLLLLVPLVLFSIGCADSQFPLAPVSGKITLEGKPLEGARVVFMPRSDRKDGEAGPYSKGETDAEGRFQLATVTRPPMSGAVVGTHRVIVSTRKARLDPENPMREIVDAEEIIPRLYHDYTRTPLECDVPTEGNEAADFNL